MGTLFLIGRASIATVIVVVFLQIRIGDRTLEQRSEAFIRDSSFVGHFQKVASGALIIVNKAVVKVQGVFATKVAKVVDKSNLPGHRLDINLERSKGFVREKAEKARQAAQRAREVAQQRAQEQVQEQVEDLQEEHLQEHIPLGE